MLIQKTSLNFSVQSQSSQNSKTVIMIAHRLKTVRKANQILVLDKGRIVQRGTHESLMAEGGIYADFVNMREKTVGWKNCLTAGKTLKISQRKKYAPKLVLGCI